MFAAFRNIQNAPANNYCEQSDNLEDYLPSNAKIIFGVASILGTFNPYTEVSGVNIVLHDESPRTIWFRIYNNLSFPVNLKIAYICFYIET